MNVTLCTLFEGDYHHGVAALANSLIHAGYSGDFWVGYRGALPQWMMNSSQSPSEGLRTISVGGLRLRLVEVVSAKHLALFKPEFLRQVLDEWASDADIGVYFDPDIVVKCDWTDFEGWFTPDAISVVVDVNWAFPVRHPKRLMWDRFFGHHDLVRCRALDRYYNSGFIAVPRSCVDVLEKWRTTCDLVVADLSGAPVLKTGSPASIFHSTDQDALNFTLTATDVPINSAGPDAMDFAPGGYYMSHAVGRDKPWRARFIRRAMRGVPPSSSAKHYQRFAGGPVRSIPIHRLRWQRTSLRVAAAITRFYRRGG